MQQIAFDDEAAWQSYRQQWPLPPGVANLNHGSFGASPKAVMASRARWYEQLESNPVDFFLRKMDPALGGARKCLGDFLGAAADDLVFMENATFAMNVVAASTRLQPGDEVLINDHEYGAVLRIWQQKCQREDARLVVQKLPVPVVSEEEVVDTLLARVTERTRLLVVSHVTSPTAIVLPVEAICRRARSLGLSVCVDGPHALAMLRVDLAGLDCDYYTASCHKWLCAPFGSGFLYAHPRVQAAIRPALVSWGCFPPGRSPSWRDEFIWIGTRDPSAFLAVPTAVEFLEKVGLEAFRGRTHYLAQLARQKITQLTGLQPLVPDSPQWYGSMISLPLPDGEAQPLQDALWDQCQIEVPVFQWQGRRLVRVSCHLYTRAADIDRLVNALSMLVDWSP